MHPDGHRDPIGFASWLRVVKLRSSTNPSCSRTHARKARSPEIREAGLGAIRAARWWRVATARSDDEESALDERGGFFADIEADEALEVDVLASPGVPRRRARSRLYA